MCMHSLGHCYVYAYVKTKSYLWLDGDTDMCMYRYNEQPSSQVELYQSVYLSRDIVIVCKGLEKVVHTIRVRPVSFYA